MPPVQRRSETKKKRPPRTARPHNHPRNGIGRGACGKNGTGNENPRCRKTKEKVLAMSRKTRQGKAVLFIVLAVVCFVLMVVAGMLMAHAGYNV